MGRRKLTKAEKAARTIRRDNERSEREEKRGKLATWFQLRAQAAEERKEQAREDRQVETEGNARAREAYQRHAQKTPVPRTLPASVGVVNLPDSKLGEYRGRAGNYADRRAWGQRGHQRKPRARELPGAEARRLERNRQGWL